MENETNESLIERDETTSTRQTHKNPIPLTLLFVFVSSCIVVVTLMIYWIATFMKPADGKSPFATDNQNWHFIWMILFVVLTAIGTLSFRLFTSTSRLMAKIIHAVSLTAAFVIAALGLSAKWKENGLAGLFSLHSWLGFGLVLFFGIQWSIGVISFLLSLVPPNTRAKVVVYHRAMGTVITISIAAIAAIGIEEKMFFKLAEYKEKTTESTIANLAGLAVMAVGALSIFIQIKPEYKRIEQRRSGIAMRNLN